MTVATSAKRTLRIAILLPDLRAGGAEKLHLVLAAQWLQCGHRVAFVLRRKVGELLHQLPEGVEVVDLGASRVRAAFWPLLRYLRRNPPDVLLAAMWPLTVLAIAASLLVRFRGRVLVSEHSPLSLAYAGRGWLHRLLLRWSLRLAYPRAGGRIAVSSGVAEDLASLCGLPRDCFTVIHNPTAFGIRAGGYPVPELLEGVVGPVILTVGSLKKVKRHDVLIEAFARLERKIGATLCIVGDGAEREALVRQVESAGLGKHVIFARFVADPSPWYAHANLFVLSSDYEGFGNVLVEAMVHGLNIVSTDCPVGPREVLMDGTYGLLVPVADAAAMAAAIEKALSEPVPEAALRERAAVFSAEKIADQYLRAMQANDEPGQCARSQHGSEL